jgi:hypothetical protein
MTFTLRGRSLDYQNKKVYSEQDIEELRQQVHLIIGKDDARAFSVDQVFGVIADGALPPKTQSFKDKIITKKSKED